MLTKVLQRYQDYDPDTGLFNLRRSVRQYAALLGVNHATLLELYRLDDREPSTMVLSALSRLFPAASTEIATALAAAPTPAAAKQAVAV